MLILSWYPFYKCNDALNAITSAYTMHIQNTVANKKWINKGSNVKTR